MKLKQVQKNLGKEIGVIAVVLGLFGGLFHYTASLETDLQKELGKFESAKRSLDGKVAGTRQEYESLIEAFETHKKVLSHRLPTDDGLSNAASRIRAARPIIESLKERFYMVDLNVTFPTRQRRTQQNNSKNRSNDASPYDLKTMSVVDSSMVIQFKGMTDELVFSFIQSLVQNFPGYLHLVHFKMSRQDEITTEFINDIYRKETLRPLVGGEMTFDWKTLKNNPQPENDEGAT